MVVDARLEVAHLAVRARIAAVKIVPSLFEYAHERSDTRLHDAVESDVRRST